MASLAADPREWTPEQITEGIASAIRDRNFRAVEGLLMLLALKDGYEAERMYETLKVAVALAQAG